MQSDAHELGGASNWQKRDGAVHPFQGSNRFNTWPSDALVTDCQSVMLGLATTA